MRLNLVLAALVAVLLAGACGLAAAPEETFCDGISSLVGGCDPDRPKFAGLSCDDVAREFGREIDSRVLAIYRGPESTDESKAVRAGHATSVTTSLANRHLRRVGLIKECAAPAFLEVAETQFSADLRAHGPEILYDGPPVSYEQWRKELLALLSIIDMEEDAIPPS